MDEAPREFGFNTRAVHAGQRPDPYTGASATPIYQTAGFVFEDTESASAYFNLQEYGNVYSRIMNPTVAAFEERLANLEGGVGAVAFASGLAAQAALFFALLEPGDRIAVAKALYGGSTAQLNHLARKLQISLDWVDMDDPDGWRRSVTADTKALFAETIANPGGNVLDISLAAAVAHEVGAPLIVDNTFATPYLCRPLEFGADLIIHSATKFIAGNGTTIAGAVVDSGAFDWSNGRFPAIAIVGRVPRPQVPRDVRRLRAADEAALRDAPRLRRGAGALQRVPAGARAGVARGADGPPRRERARGRRMAA